MRYILFFLFLFFPAVSPAEDNYYNVGGQKQAVKTDQETKTLVVTSIQKCYDQLDPEDAAEIRKNYIKPYQECQRRLSAKLKEKQHLKAGDKEAPAGKTDDHFYRVQKSSAPSTEKQDEKKPEKNDSFQGQK